MSRPACFVKALALFALVTLCVPANAQITIPDPGGILGKILRLPKPKANPNVPASQIAPPANDNFADREQLVGADARASVDNRGRRWKQTSRSIGPVSKTSALFGGRGLPRT